MDVEDALEMLEEYQTYWSIPYKLAAEDLEFAYTPGAQWRDEDRKLRESSGMACVQVNLLLQFIHQVTNQMRQNTPSINVSPGDAESSVENAKIRKGLIRNIEYRSGADEVYDTAGEYQVACSIGFIRVDHAYVSSDSFQQEILIKRVQNPLANWIDPASIECDGSDAEGAICLETITRKQFEKKYPGKSFTSFESGSDNRKDDGKRESITLAEIFIKKYETSEKQQNDDGSIVDYVDDGKKKKKRTLKKTVICRYKFSGADCLEETTFPGEYIPLVPVYGQEVWIDGRRTLNSLIRQAKDPSRRYNYWVSVEAEILKKSPKAPWVAEAGTIEEFAEDWQNPDSPMVLRWTNKNTNGEPANAPQRTQPISVSPGILAGTQNAYEDVKRALGMYDASVGQKSNETSGVAIDARKEQGDVATFHFTDNRTRSIAHVGVIANGMISTIYDTAQIVQIIGEEDEVESVAVNGHPLVAGQSEQYDLTKGNFDIRVTTGPSFTSVRQENEAFMMEASKANPRLWELAGDLIVKNRDPVLSARLRKTIPKELTAEEDAKKEGQQPPTEKEQQLMMALQQMQQQIQEMAPLVEGKQAELQMKDKELQLKAGELQIKSQAEQTKAENERIKLQLEAEKIQLDREKLAQDGMKMKMDATLAAHAAMQPSEPPNESGEPMLDPNSPDEALMAHMNARRQKQQQADELAAQQAADALAEKEAEAQERQIDQALKEAQIKVSLDMGNAIVQAMQGISAQLNELSSKVNTPMQVVRDNNGMIVGAAPARLN